MKIYQVVSGDFAVNTYFAVNEETSEAVIIDAGDYDKIKSEIEKKGLKIKACILTHGHFDHIVSCKKLQDEGIKIYISAVDADKLYTDNNLGVVFDKNVEKLKADYVFTDGEELELAGIKFKVMATPGHTEGSVCFITDNVIFSGDTLFFEDVGRTDLLGGDSKILKKSIIKLFSLKGEYMVYPGHGRATTLSHEKENNFYI